MKKATRKDTVSELKLFYLESNLKRDVALCIFNSPQFFVWFFSIYSDVRNVNRTGKVFAFPCSIEKQMDKKTSMGLLQQKVQKLMKDFQNNSVSIINHYKKYGKLTIQAFQPRISKPIMDEIDSLLAIYYGLTR